MRAWACVSTIIACAAAASAAQRPPAAPAIACKADAGWNDPAAPRHIYGNVWYVGTCGITALLVTSDSGHVLIDAATEQAAPQIAANIKTLGFQITDVKLMLATHAHLDHAGGFAALQRESGATVVSRGLDAAAIERGKGDRSDPQFLAIDGFPAAKKVRRVADGETVKLGPLAFMAQATPGHTPGSTSWTWDACEAGRCLHFVYADSVTAISDDEYRYTDEAAHPGVVAAFRKSLARLAELPCDVLLTPHPGVSNMFARIGPGATQPLSDPNACRALAAQAGETLDKRIAKEKSGR